MSGDENAFSGLSIIDLEALRVQAEDELDTVRAAYPDSPSIPALEDHVSNIADEIRRYA